MSYDESFPPNHLENFPFKQKAPMTNLVPDAGWENQEGDFTRGVITFYVNVGGIVDVAAVYDYMDGWAERYTSFVHKMALQGVEVVFIPTTDPTRIEMMHL